ncbi:apolipoprotein L3-like [Trichosurus vulpecula]|uniref:apolipoprotein L3-like n=1 Tax=Trichosurus vulpecula TaxID=9337 RepID=UPI00186B41E9|nr:apolipoprotein L3-like [Trichosurus vulpecula]XP_036616296.1 apolipoprotein L3-like [Trichosurus vulpecula]
MDGADEDLTYENMQTEVKKFLKAFPDTKLQLEKLIKELRCLADKIDKVHKNCTITGVAASSTGAISGLLTIAGFALAPVTAGGSLALCMSGTGLGVAATLTGIAASVIDISSDSQGKKELDEVEGKIKGIVEPLTILISGIVGAMRSLSKSFHDVIPNARALGLVKSSPGLINKSFTGTVLAMTKKARIRGAMFAGVFVLMDIAAVVQDSMHLSKGAKAPTATKLREKAQNLKEKLQELSEIYETLQEMETQSTT